MIKIEDREFGGAVKRDSGPASESAPFLIDTAAIRNAANLLKIKGLTRF
jgi:hypothetical protein